MQQTELNIEFLLGERPLAKLLALLLLLLKLQLHWRQQKLPPLKYQQQRHQLRQLQQTNLQQALQLKHLQPQNLQLNKAVINAKDETVFPLQLQVPKLQLLMRQLQNLQLHGRQVLPIPLLMLQALLH